jgi:hypothetical protein
MGLEGKVSARVSPPRRMNKAMDTKIVRNPFFIESSFLLGLHSGFHFTKKVYFVKLISRIGEEWKGWFLIVFNHGGWNEMIKIFKRE